MTTAIRLLALLLTSATLTLLPGAAHASTTSTEVTATVTVTVPLSGVLHDHEGHHGPDCWEW